MNDSRKIRSRQRRSLLKTVTGIVALTLAATCATLFCESAVAQGIVMRDLTRRTDVSVTTFDRREIVLSDGSKIGWDEVLQAVVDPDDPQQQIAFDTNVKTIGLPLYRLKSRVKNQDWLAALETARSMQSKVDDAQFDVSQFSPETKFLIQLAMMKGNLAQGNRTSAIAPFLDAAAVQPQLAESFLKQFDGALLTTKETELGLAESLLPIWFDRDAAKSTFDALSSSRVPGADQPPGASIYLASLAISADKLDYARQLIDRLDTGDPYIGSWKEILSAQLSIASGDVDRAARQMEDALLRENREQSSSAVRAITLYLSAASHFRELPNSQPQDVPTIEDPDSSVSDKTGQSAEEAREFQAMLRLLKVSTVYGKQHPQLAAAALAQAASIMSRHSVAESKTLKENLVRQFPQTWFGQQARSAAQ